MATHGDSTGGDEGNDEYEAPGELFRGGREEQRGVRRVVTRTSTQLAVGVNPRGIEESREVYYKTSIAVVVPVGVLGLANGELLASS